MNEAELQNRITNLRAALELIRDRNPQAETEGGASESTSVGYAAEVRRYAELALAEDDARIAAEE
jgi:hypothetical protein